MGRLSPRKGFKMEYHAVVLRQQKNAKIGAPKAAITAAPEKTAAAHCLGFASWDLNEADADRYAELLDRADHAYKIELNLEAKLAGAARATRLADLRLLDFKRTYHTKFNFYKNAELRRRFSRTPSNK